MRPPSTRVFNYDLLYHVVFDMEGLNSQREVLDALNWIYDGNLGKPWAARPTDRTSAIEIATYSFYFSVKEDATLFMLFWGGELDKG